MSDLDYSERVAQEYVDKLADDADNNENIGTVHRFTPSVMHGRRYFGFYTNDGYAVMVQVDVQKK